MELERRGKGCGVEEGEEREKIFRIKKGSQRAECRRGEIKLQWTSDGEKPHRNANRQVGDWEYALKRESPSTPWCLGRKDGTFLGRGHLMQRELKGRIAGMKKCSL